VHGGGSYQELRDVVHQVPALGRFPGREWREEEPRLAVGQSWHARSAVHSHIDVDRKTQGCGVEPEQSIDDLGEIATRAPNGNDAAVEVEVTLE
jgi:hypothetical protein